MLFRQLTGDIPEPLFYVVGGVNISSTVTATRDLWSLHFLLRRARVSADTPPTDTAGDDVSSLDCLVGGDVSVDFSGCVIFIFQFLLGIFKTAYLTVLLWAHNLRRRKCRNQRSLVAVTVEEMLTRPTTWNSGSGMCAVNWRNNKC